MTDPSQTKRVSVVDDSELDELVSAIPEGWSRIDIDGAAWGITRTTRAGGKVISVEAERLGAGEGFGGNIWLTTKGPVLKPCEVPAERVLRVLEGARAALSAADSAAPS